MKRRTYEEITHEELNSVEIGRDTKGNVKWTVKVYDSDVEKAMEKAKQIDEKLREWKESGSGE